MCGNFATTPTSAKVNDSSPFIRRNLGKKRLNYVSRDFVRKTLFSRKSSFILLLCLAAKVPSKKILLCLSFVIATHRNVRPFLSKSFFVASLFGSVADSVVVQRKEKEKKRLFWRPPVAAPDRVPALTQPGHNETDRFGPMAHAEN